VVMRGWLGKRSGRRMDASMWLGSAVLDCATPNLSIGVVIEAIC
jgi:hypothetical protein